MLETVFVLLVILLYFGLWTLKRIVQIRKDKIDPQVMSKSSSSIQKYMNSYSIFLTIFVVILIPVHSLDLVFFGLLSRFHLLDAALFDVIGFASCILGLFLCLYSQIKMGRSWRVGIDTQSKTDLITAGLYSLIRNPTYLGLFFVCVGVWIIWPTFAMFVFSGMFILFLEIQVRCEEDFLSVEFGEEYVQYKARTKRYIPLLY